MITKKTILALTLLTLQTNTFAQRIATLGSSIDCGQVMFRQPVTVEYEITNKGGKPLVISKVLTDCGCTAVDYPKTAIIKGDVAKLHATYDAKQMGHFQKRIAIYSNGSAKPLMLTLSGVVVNEIKNFAGNYPYRVNGVPIDRNEIEFDNVNKGDKPYVLLHLLNTTSQTIQPTLMHLPAYLKAKCSPSKIAPNHTGEIELLLDSRRLPDYGLTQISTYLGLHPGEEVGEQKEIPISAVLLPRFDYDEADLIEAPKLKLSATDANLGKFDGKKKLKGGIDISNTGLSTLDITSLQMFTRGLEISLNKTHIEPGETAKLKITAINDELKKARSKPRVLMITNDPAHPKVVINIITE
jgi:hypothetical protein